MQNHKTVPYISEACSVKKSTRRQTLTFTCVTLVMDVSEAQVKIINTQEIFETKYYVLKIVTRNQIYSNNMIKRVEM